MDTVLRLPPTQSELRSGLAADGTAWRGNLGSRDRFDEEWSEMVERLSFKPEISVARRMGSLTKDDEKERLCSAARKTYGSARAWSGTHWVGVGF